MPQDDELFREADGDDVRPPAEVADDRLRGRRVLVVDPDVFVCQRARVLLERHGCTVRTAHCGQAALELAGQGPFDAFLLDIRQPDGPAYEFYRRLRELMPEAIPVMMTDFNHDAEHAIIKARQNGLRAVLYKPFLPDQVIEAVAGPQRDGAA